MNTIQAEQCLHSEMRASQQGQAMAQSQGDNNPQNKTKKAQAMMRLGKKNLGGATAQQDPRCT